ncbi:hypothetical protein [Methylobacterium sp. ap11]|uniref:hypothetical protein n=1 Tax=Methylobacterium sp. ap11 TaxID=1761799 RepID=UPI0015A50990|nr:hypothetical protein [Methylobacterium sp. ap11]
MAGASDDIGLENPPSPIIKRRIRWRRAGDPIFRTPQVARRAGLSLEIPARNREEPERQHTATRLEVFRRRMIGRGSDGDPAGQQEHDQDDEQDPADAEAARAIASTTQEAAAATFKSVSPPPRLLRVLAKDNRQ